MISVMDGASDKYYINLQSGNEIKMAASLVSLRICLL